MDELDITGEGLPGDAQLTPPGSQPASNVPTPESLTLDELKGVLGKEFPNKDAALKSIKDTFTAVVQKREVIENEIKSNQKYDELSSELKKLRTDLFYKENPEYSEYRGLIDKLGGDPQEVVKSEEFSKVFSRAKEYDTIQNSRTVLESNPRIVQSRDSLQKGRDAIAEGKKALGEQLIGDAVVKAFNL